ncbi:MAG: AarF/UbiB family protein, partial [Myxococcota bacterium]
MAAQVAGTEVRHRVKQTLSRSVDKLASDSLKAKIQQAQIITQNLGQLKGAVMKAGQLLSIDASDFLPPEVLDVLSKLQSNAEPVEFCVIKGVLDEELGADWPDKLEQLSPTPVASASIGQVHRATFRGQPVAVKVQYPGIDKSIDSDLSLLRKLSGSYLSLTGRKIDLGGLFEEMRDLLQQESNYRVEAEHLEKYRKLLSAEHRFVVPSPYPDVSGQRVLTMSWEEGPSLHAWLRSDPSYAEREWMGRAILDLYCLEFFEWGFVQTDPNPANFLVRGPQRQLVLLDLGAAMHYDADFINNYVRLLSVLGTRDREGTAKGELVPVHLMATKVDSEYWENHAYELAGLGFGVPLMCSSKTKYMRRTMLDELYEIVPDTLEDDEERPDPGLKIAIVG